MALSYVNFYTSLCTRPDCHCKEIMAWSLSGFPSGPLPVLHTFSTKFHAKSLPNCQCRWSASLLPAIISFLLCLIVALPSSAPRLPWPWDTHLLERRMPVTDMHKVDINVMCQSHIFTQGFLIAPHRQYAKILNWESRIIRFWDMDVDHSMFHLGKVSIHALDPFHMALSRGSSERGQSHYSSHLIKLSNRDYLLKSTNEGLVLAMSLPWRRSEVSSSGCHFYL